MKLSIIIPAYNEEKRIEPTLRKYYNFFKKKDIDFEILVVVNNSNDGTLQICIDFAEYRDEIRVFHIWDYVGKGGAVHLGFLYAEGDYLGFVDADNSTIPYEFWKLFLKMKDSKVDCVIGSRRMLGSKITPPRTFTQNISSWMFNKITRSWVGLDFEDTQCGAKIFKKNVIESWLVADNREFGWAFDVDLLNICKANNYKVLEVPINWKDTEGSKLSFFSGAKAAFKLFILPER